uniref:G-protein coupled receptors family 1 profile domain-containing protein n=1 Tax=Panagrolaimus sp. ES5 TaxID=591445 RepID=A0AC34FDJ6_9BILA
MRSITNLYLLNLALSDLLLSVVCMPPTLVSSLVYCWVFGDLLCKLLAYLQPVVVTASAYTLAAIALERYYAICKPLHSRIWHTRSHAFCVIGIVWLISIIANLFMLFMYELRTYNRTGLNCAPKYKPIVHFGYQIYMTVVLLVIPLVLMTVLYGSVIKSLRSGLKMDIAAIEVAENSMDRLDSAKPGKLRSSSLVTGKSRKMNKFRTALFLSFGCKRNALRTRFQKVYAPGNNDTYRTTAYPNSNNASFREPESQTSNNETQQPKELKRSMSLTFNVFTRLRSVISKKESPKEQKRLV